MDDPAQQLATRAWGEYKRTGAQAARDQLIVLYSPLVKYVASRVAVGLPAHVDREDLVSYGVIGLIDAIDRFDPDRQIRFETYAIARIRGAIIDEMRSIDWVPRSVRAKARAVDQAYTTLHGSLKRAPTDAEVAAELGVGEDELQDTLRRISALGMAALDEMFAVGNDQSERASLASMIIESSAGPAAMLEEEESRRLLLDAIKQLNERQRTVLLLYYFEELTLAEIGQILGVTESRVCQIRTEAVLQLRGRLNGNRHPTRSAVRSARRRPQREKVAS